MAAKNPYDRVIVVGAGNTGLSMGYQGVETTENPDQTVFLCGTEGHPGNTVPVVKAGSAITVDDFRLQLSVKAHVKIARLEDVMLSRQGAGRVAIIINTTVDVHDDVARQLRRCNLTNVDIIGHPSLFLAHFLDKYLDEDGVPDSQRPRVFLIDVTVFAARANADTVTLTGKKDDLEIALYGGDVTDEDCSRVASFFGIPETGLRRTKPFTELNNIANPWAHGWPMLELAPRIKAGELDLLFYVSPSKEAHDKADGVSDDVKAYGARHGLDIRNLTEKARTMYQNVRWESYHHFANKSSAHNTIPAPKTDDVRLIWEEERITSLQLECAERLDDDIPKLRELRDALLAYMTEHLPHRLGREITLEQLGIGPEYRGQAFIDRYNGVYDKTGRVAPVGTRAANAPPSTGNPPPLRYPGMQLPKETPEEFLRYWRDLNM